MTRRKSSAPQLLMEPQQQRPNELVLQDSREEQLEQVISKSSESDNVMHDVINAEKIIPLIIESAIPVELIGKIDLRRCTSPPHELSPYLNSNGIRMNSKLVPKPKGPDCKTESPLSAGIPHVLAQTTGCHCPHVPGLGLARSGPHTAQDISRIRPG